MNNIPLNFDASQVKPREAFESLPPGEYTAEITDSEVKDTKDNTGKYLQFEFTVLEGEFAGRKMWDRLNLSNPNKTAEEIARETLSAICHAVGHLRVGDASELHNRPLVIIVKPEKNRETGERDTRIKGYKAVGAGGPAPFAGSAPAAQQGAAFGAKPSFGAAPAQQAAPAQNAAPWAKRA